MSARQGDEVAEEAATSSQSRDRDAASLAALGALLAAIGVAAGAFGAHALRGRIDALSLQVFETGVRYQLIHALGVIVAALAFEQRPRGALAAAGWLFAAGIVLFSGSLYGLALGGPKTLGAVAPLGGACFIAGWLAFTGGAWPRRR